MSGWVKVPEDWFSSEAVERLPAEVVLFHLSALAESGRHRRDGFVPVGWMRRLWLVDDPHSVVRELVTNGWWQPTEGGWLIRDWRTFLLSAAEIEHRRSVSRESSERYRRHKAGDHSMCDRCSAVRDASRDLSRDKSGDKSVTSPDSIRSDPKGRRGEEGAGSVSADAEPTAATKRPPPHNYNPSGDCCPLPPHHPVHAQSLRTT